MNLQDHHVVSLRLSAPEQLPEDGTWHRTLTWLDRDGREHTLTLFAEFGPECLPLLGEKPVEARLDRYAGQARESTTCPRCHAVVNLSWTYLAEVGHHCQACGFDYSSYPGTPDEGSANLREEARKPVCAWCGESYPGQAALARKGKWACSEPCRDNIDATYIVRCVNSHEQLVAALTSLDALIDFGYEYEFGPIEKDVVIPLSKELVAAFALARTALAAAKE